MTLAIVRRLLPGWGTTYGPPGDGPFPAVLILHGSEGGPSGWGHRNAAILAAQGFLAYPHTYSVGGNAWNAGAIRDVPLDRTLEALAALRAFPPVAGKVGFYGVSRGAEHALLVATLMAAEQAPGLPDAVAAHSPPDVICGAFDSRRWRDRGDPGWQVWDPADRAWTWRGSSDRLLPTEPIALERYPGPIFLSHGSADSVWSVAATRRLAARLAAADRRPGPDLEVHYYEGEDHLLSSEAENLHHDRLTAFLAKHLAWAAPCAVLSAR